MSDWNSFRKEHYGKDFRTIYGKGVIDFGCDGMNAVKTGVSAPMMSISKSREIPV